MVIKAAAEKKKKKKKEEEEEEEKAKMPANEEKASRSIHLTVSSD